VKVAIGASVVMWRRAYHRKCSLEENLMTLRLLGVGHSRSEPADSFFSFSIDYDIRKPHGILRVFESFPRLQCIILRESTHSKRVLELQYLRSWLRRWLLCSLHSRLRGWLQCSLSIEFVCPECFLHCNSNDCGTSFLTGWGMFGRLEKLAGTLFYPCI